jgi:1-acyl-sn-glycerol-3-phosphate acyltransferase
MLAAPTNTSTQRRSYLALFVNVSFVLLWTGQLISYLGDRLDQMTLLQWAKGVTLHLDAVMTMIGFYSLLPFLLFAPWAGPTADRYSRKGILLWMSLFLGILVGAIPTVGETAFARGHLKGMIYLVTFLIGAFTVFFYTAKTALIPQIVADTDLMAANSLCSFAGTLMTLLGTFVASALLHLHEKGVFSLDVMFYLDAASYVISGAMFAFIIVPKRRAFAPTLVREESYSRKIRAALRYVRDHQQVLKLLTLSAMVYFTAGLVFAVVNGVSVGPKGFAPNDVEIYALVVGVLGIGMVTGAVATTFGKNRIRSYERFIALCFAVTAAAALPFLRLGRLVPWVQQQHWSSARVVWEILAPPLFVLGLGGGALIVLVITLLQRTTPRRFHGRIFALNSMCEVGPQLLAMGIGAALLASGLVKTVITLAFVFMLAAMVSTLVSNEFSRHWLIRLIVRFLVKVYCRQRTQGREHVPAKGALIVASNHVSWLDTLFVGAAVPRLIHFIAAREYYDLWYLKWVMWLFGTISLERGKGLREPFRRALAALQRGRVLGVFPEGRMSLNGEFQPLQGGIALMAEETGALILPVAILGGSKVMGPAQSFPQPRTVRVRIGPPIDPAGLSRDEILARVDTAIRSLLQEPARS